MSQNTPIREWLHKHDYEDIAELIEQVMAGWKRKGTKTRRNWWAVLAGNKNGTPKVIEGVTFPILKTAQARQGMTVTDNALCRNETEVAPGVVTGGRWAHRSNMLDAED
ncbi:hypothetical protein LJC46_07150 [Desulfovibrio sp. OttesenSCG-928-G15]|nr:hypothetical protein [Desulfovibrio sp. OttesenSCG-928-G15]